MANKQLYTPLSKSKNDIRLLDLEPSNTNFNSSICCHLRHAVLRPGLNFTALSYTWGDPTVRKPISTNGHTMNVTVNLYDALQHMRDASQRRTFWIDAVCINQNDILERNAQVLRMCEIYGIASSVEVWLGKEAENDAAGMSVVKELGASVSNAEDILSKPLSDKNKEDFFNILSACNPEVARAVGRLFKRPWWTRVWVVQELSLANQATSIVRCGAQVAPWLSFLVTAYAINEFWSLMNGIISTKFPDERLDGTEHGVRMAQCRNINPEFPGFTLLELLNQHRDCEATDPRDKIYGLLGLAGDVDTIGVQPSYTSPPQGVYTDLVRKHVTATSSLDILCEVRHPRKLAGLPSWVPDWSTDQTVPGICIHDRYLGGNNFPGSPIPQFEKYAASGSSRAAVAFFNTTLGITVVPVGLIVFLGKVDNGMALSDLGDIETLGHADEEGYSGSNIEIFNNWLNLVLKSPNWEDIEKRYGADNVLEVFCRTLISNRNGQMMKPPNSSKIDDEDRDMSDVITEDGEEEEQVAAEMLSMSHETFASCLMVSWGKRLAILDSGHIGIVPEHSALGDAAFIALGCSVPLILRKRGSSAAILIGESYIHGIMDGEYMDRSTETISLQ
ncbi:HET-domain-containing protein [Lojkania enalia]|uniref:HET-domain-containing protein n=1 Tax=Lojkania enalia TaxID=147567 RepID=A0A9P4K4K5_9PLEO|nr:HET-domain-containing protein [Didymosphaeria enalia]